jgi:hypothetical protein
MENLKMKELVMTLGQNGRVTGAPGWCLAGFF